MSTNQQQVEAWNGGESVHYVDHADRYDRQLAPITDALIERARITADETVLDVGCGCGVTTLAAAAKARRAVGLDISVPLIDVAIDRARSSEATNAEFVVADAQTHAFGDATHDLVISQFGLMFFDEPVTAFANLAAALVPGGRAVFATWQPLAANGWLEPVAAAVAQYTDLPSLGGLDRGPGMFALHDRSEITELLEASGFAGISIDAATPQLLVGGGGTVDEAAEFLFGMGIVRGLLSHVDEADREAARRRVRSALDEHHEPGVGVRLEAGVWLVSASASG